MPQSEKCELYAGKEWIGLGQVNSVENGYRYHGGLKSGLASLDGGDLVLRITRSDNTEIEYPVAATDFTEGIGSFSGTLTYDER